MVSMKRSQSSAQFSSCFSCVMIFGTLAEKTNPSGTFFSQEEAVFAPGMKCQVASISTVLNVFA